MKTAELTGAALDWAVAQIEKPRLSQSFARKNVVVLAHGGVYSPSANWAQGGPIIERECIELTCTDEWKAFMRFRSSPCDEDGPTPLIAAMRCYVSSKLGDDVDVPEELK